MQQHVWSMTTIIHMEATTVCPLLTMVGSKWPWLSTGCKITSMTTTKERDKGQTTHAWGHKHRYIKLCTKYSGFEYQQVNSVSRQRIQLLCVHNHLDIHSNRTIARFKLTGHMFVCLRLMASKGLHNLLYRAVIGQCCVYLCITCWRSQCQA